MGHDHAHPATRDQRSLLTAFGLLVAFMVVEVVVAAVSGSVALLADAGHMLSDAGALLAAWWALRLSARPATDAWTYGLHRAEVLSAAGNGVTLLVAGALLTAEAVRRLVHPGPVAGLAVLLTAVLGIVVNAAATWVLARADQDNLGVRGAVQHVVTDLWAFVATAAAGVLVLATGWRRADPVASLVVVALMLRAAWGLLRDSGRVLLEATPEGVDLADLRQHLLQAEHVVDVHDLHAWSVASALPALSAHVVVDADCFARGLSPQVLDALQACLAGHFDVEHSTFQLEPPGHVEHESATHA